MSIGARLREARLAAGLSARELARLTASGHANILRIESGEQPKPGAEKIASFARALGVRVDWLMTGEGLREAPPVNDAPRDDDPYPARAAAISRLRGLVSDDAIARVRADQLLGALSESEWAEELLRADRLMRKGLERFEGQAHTGDGPAGRTSSKIQPRRR